MHGMSRSLVCSFARSLSFPNLKSVLFFCLYLLSNSEINLKPLGFVACLGDRNTHIRIEAKRGVLILQANRKLFICLEHRTESLWNGIELHPNSIYFHI